MGFGKFLMGGLCAVGAVIAAPVVLPAAAAGAVAAGAAAVGTAAAAGTAVATAGAAAVGTVAAAGTAVATAGAAAVGTVAAAGTAVAEAAAAVGTAAAGTAVGGVAVTAMGTVGSVVGGVADVVGLSSVAAVAGNLEGAVAVGTIATSTAVGAGTAVSGAKKMLEASELKEEAELRYKNERDKFDKIENQTKEKLENLGKEKVFAWDCFGKFIDTYKKINNKGRLVGKIEKEELPELSENELKDIQILAISAKDFIKGGVITATSSQLVGMAVSTGITSIATASTGAAISGLHGAAASNAALAALGGGAKSAGGLGIAGGTIVSQALVLAPAAAIGGIFINSKGNKVLDDAEKINSESRKVVEKLKEAEKELDKLGNLVLDMTNAMHMFCEIFEKNVNWMRELVNRNNNAEWYSAEEKHRIAATSYQLKILKKYTMINLIEDNGYRTDKAESEKRELEKNWNDLK